MMRPSRLHLVLRGLVGASFVAGAVEAAAIAVGLRPPIVALAATVVVFAIVVAGAHATRPRGGLRVVARNDDRSLDRRGGRPL
jgi:hypothetical protein